MRIELASGHTVLADDADLELLLPHSWYLTRAKGSSRLYAAARIRRTPEDEKEELVYRLWEEFAASVKWALDDERKFVFLAGARSAIYELTVKQQGASDGR